MFHRLCGVGMLTRAVKPNLGLNGCVSRASRRTSRLNMPNMLVPTRNFRLSAGQLQAVKGWGFIFNIVAGAYIGGLIVCLGSLYLLYQDANERQPIPFELSFKNQITAVKAINKDDALKSPRYAVKHYRRLLIEIAKKEDPNYTFDEFDPENLYRAPILDSDILLGRKSNIFANFYVDIVSRYAKALLAKGQLEVSIETLKKVVEDDKIFYQLGDAERLSQCCRLLAKITPAMSEKEMLYSRSIDMIRKTFSSIKLTPDFLFEDNSRITDELIRCLNDLAFSYGKESARDAKHKQEYLTKSLNIYLSNLKVVQNVQYNIANGTHSQSTYPLFNCDANNLEMTINEIRCHISEIMWAKGYKKNAVSWGEEVIDNIYYLHSTNKRANEILYHDLSNLIAMYNQTGNRVGVERCQKLQNGLQSFELNDSDWYNNFINRMCKIIYNKGPLGVLEKALLERFGPATRLLEIEEFELEDQE